MCSCTGGEEICDIPYRACSSESEKLILKLCTGPSLEILVTLSCNALSSALFFSSSLILDLSPSDCETWEPKEIGGTLRKSSAVDKSTGPADVEDASPCLTQFSTLSFYIFSLSDLQTSYACFFQMFS